MIQMQSYFQHSLKWPANVGWIAFLILAIAVLPGCAQRTFAEMADDMSGKNVPTVHGSELDSSAILLDAREYGEYAVSHIAGARWVGYDGFDFKSVEDIPKNQKIVVYCSVGYRSGRIVEKLGDKGFTNVYNLWGGIFDWVNTGHVVTDSTGVTRNIHPYNERWGKWLTQGNKVYE